MSSVSRLLVVLSLPLGGASMAQGSAGGSSATQRPRLPGVDTSLFYTVDALGLVDGGRERGADVLGNLDLVVTTDLEELAGLRGTRALFHGIADHGGSFSDRVGDAQIVSSIEAPETVRLFEAWVETDFAASRASARVGLYDVNGEFDVLPSAGLFLNSSYGHGAEFGNSGRNGPSAFPVTSLAARLAWRPTDAGYVRAVVADGVPGDPRHPDATAIRFDAGDGLLFAVEAGTVGSEVPEVLGRTRIRLAELPPGERPRGWFHKFAIGVHGYTDGLGAGRDRGAVGVHLLAEQSLYVERDAPERGLAAFARLSWADAAIGPFDAFASAGLVYRGPCDARPDDRIGLAVAVARFSDRGTPTSGGFRLDYETDVELTWRAPVNDWLTLQPDVQYVRNPGGDPGLDDAWVVGLRGIVSF